MNRLPFPERITTSAKEKRSRIILALDLQEPETDKMLERATNILDEVSDSLAAVKLNYQVLLPLDLHKSVKKIVDQSHDLGLQTIADIKLNDIASTNLTVAGHLWKAGFDALIANPFVGYEGGLGPVIQQAHDLDRGVILLVYMSHPGSVEGYGLTVTLNSNRIKAYELFLDNALKWKADGVVVGANSPHFIKELSSRAGGKILILSPGIGVQGGSADVAIRAGSDLLIIGRAIIESPQPQVSAESIRQATWRPY